MQPVRLGRASDVPSRRSRSYPPRIPRQRLTGTPQILRKKADPGSRQRHGAVREGIPGPSIFQPVAPGQEHGSSRECAARRSAIRRPLTRPAERSERRPSVCSESGASGQGDCRGSSRTRRVPSSPAAQAGAHCAVAPASRTTRSTPRTEPRIPRFQQLADRDGGCLSIPRVCRPEENCRSHAVPRLESSENKPTQLACVIRRSNRRPASSRRPTMASASAHQTSRSKGTCRVTEFILCRFAA